MCSLESYLVKRDQGRINYSVKEIFEECGIGEETKEGLILKKQIREATHSTDYTPTHVSTRRGRDIILKYLRGEA